MATRFACDARIQPTCTAASSKRAVQAVNAAPLNVRKTVLRQSISTFTPVLRSSRARDVAMSAVAPVEAGAPVDPEVGTVSPIIIISE